MSTMTAPRVSQVPNARLSTAGLLRSEWTKLRSLRSTMWSLAVAVLLIIGMAALVTAVTAAEWQQMEQGDREQAATPRITVFGAYLAQLAVGVLGVLLISGEYATGMIRATMAAVPKRLPALFAKVAVFAVVTYVVMQLALLAAFLIGGGLLRSTGISLSFDQPNAMRVLVGAALYLTAVGVFGMALGTLLRHSAGAISTLVGILLVLPILANFLPGSWGQNVQKFLPGEAGSQVLNTEQFGDALAPWTGFGVFVAYVAATLLVAAVLLKRRDV